jgi:predicted lipoprotein with Yx(FWY)xxD motif
MITSNPTLGQILVDGKGMTLYTYTKDTKDNSTCYEACAANWPPLLTTDTPKIVSALVNDNFGVITRTNGDKQITYKGMPLYYWIKDTKSGDATGENVGGVWFTHQITEEDLVK